jgi:predicted O-methyltransferase YrrM
MQDAGIDFICNYIKDNNIKRILEIGSAIGYSTIRFASISDDIQVTTIERDNDRYNEALKNIHDNDLDNRINIILGDALETNISGKYDLIFIDAAKSQYIKFFNKYKANLDINGVIFSDNLSFHGMVEDISLTHNRNTRQLVGKIRKYIEFLKDNEEFDTTFYSIGDGVSISKRKIN